MPRVYFDTTPIIYAVEKTPQYVATVDNWLLRTDVVPITSDLAWLECRVMPLRQQNQRLLRSYERFFVGAFHEVIPLSREVIDLAAMIRAEYGFKTPDALHLAAAVTDSCDMVLTNDRQLRQFREIAVEVL